jgi:CheY-like chemotaxis protein
MYRVYLGEDTPTQALFIKGVLSQGGALDITTHGDGLDLFLSIQEDPPDLIVSDILLPTLDGRALAKLVKFHDDTKHIPLVLVSAMTEEHRAGFADIGADAFLPKPLNVPELRETVARLLA